MARVTAALAIVGSLLIAAPAARAASGCEVPEGAHVKAQTRRAVVYRVRDRVVGCLEHGAGPILLERVGAVGPLGHHQFRVGPVVLAGPYVAYGSRYFGRSDGSAGVTWRDLRYPNRWDFRGNALSDRGRASVPRLVLKGDGSLAYTIRWRSLEGPDYEHVREHREVRAHDAFGRRVLDSGEHIELRSLRLHRRRLTWTKGGRGRSALLRGTGSCGLPRGARVRAHEGGIVVYSVRRSPPDQYSIDVFACSRRSGRRQRIHVEEWSDAVAEEGQHYRIAGRFVAWAFIRLDHDQNQALYVRVYDLHRHQVTRSAQVAFRAYAEQVSEGAIPAVAVSRRGDVAWTTRTYGQGSREFRSVGAWDECGRVVLDRGRRINLASLRVSRNTVTWRVRGEVRSAELRSSTAC
jgi:hypothetical protein